MITHRHYRDLRNSAHSDDVLVVAGNGPSLERVPIGFLQGNLTFGVNRITRMWPEFVPTYYCCLGWNQVDDEAKRNKVVPLLNDDRCYMAILNRFIEHEFPYSKAYFTSSRHPYGGFFAGSMTDWSDSPFEYIGVGYSNIYPVLQLAYYMGYQKVLLVGLDHYYPSGPKKHFYKDEDEPLFEVGYGPHSPEAWKAGADRMFQIAYDKFKSDKRTILNLTDETRCTVFPQDRLENWWD